MKIAIVDDNDTFRNGLTEFLTGKLNHKIVAEATTGEEFLAQEEVVNKLETEINKHPFAVALNNGFIQSLSTSMMMKDKESMSQLQKRANYVVCCFRIHFFLDAQNSL